MTPGDLDVILQSEYPLLVVGQMAAFDPLAAPGSRLLLTADGLKLEAHNGMAHAITSLAPLKSTLSLPYGAVADRCDIVCQKTAHKVAQWIKDFVEHARKACPNESMMLVTQRPGQEPTCKYPSFNETGAHLNYQPDLQEGEQVLLDVHSHGHFGAGFSTTDNKDDNTYRGDLKWCYVIGSPNKQDTTIASRWVARGHIFLQTNGHQVTQGAMNAHTSV